MQAPNNPTQGVEPGVSPKETLIHTVPLKWMSAVAFKCFVLRPAPSSLHSSPPSPTGTRLRTKAETGMNELSSRSHSVFTIYMSQTHVWGAHPTACVSTAPWNRSLTRIVKFQSRFKKNQLFFCQTKGNKILNFQFFDFFFLCI